MHRCLGKTRSYLVRHFSQFVGLALIVICSDHAGDAHTANIVSVQVASEGTPTGMVQEHAVIPSATTGQRSPTRTRLC